MRVLLTLALLVLSACATSSSGASGGTPTRAVAEVEEPVAEITVIPEGGGRAVMGVTFRTPEGVTVEKGHPARLLLGGHAVEAVYVAGPHYVGTRKLRTLRVSYRLDADGLALTELASSGARLALSDGEVYRTYAFVRADMRMGGVDG